MISFESQLHNLNAAQSLRIIRMLTAKHNLSPKEIYEDYPKDVAETKQCFINSMENNQGLTEMGRHLNASHITPSQSGMSPGRCAI
jgi:hypothetical protein